MKKTSLYLKKQWLKIFLTQIKNATTKKDLEAKVWLEEFFITYAAEKRKFIPGRSKGFFLSAIPDRYVVTVRSFYDGTRYYDSKACVRALRRNGFYVNYFDDSDWPDYMNEWYEISWDKLRKTGSIRLSVRTLDSQSKKRGSIPLWSICSKEQKNLQKKNLESNKVIANTQFTL